MSRAVFPGTGLKRSERFNHKEMVKASLLSCILPRDHYTAWHILFEECVVRSSLIRCCISVKFFSHELRQNASFSSFAADNSVYCIAQQEDVMKEESGGKGPS